MAKSDNLLAILWMLRSRERMTAGQIAEELEVDVRTVYRYIDALCASGAPILAESGPNGGYGLLDTFREAPLFFSNPERIALAHAGLFARHAGYPYSGALESALAKVERQLNPDQLQHLHLHSAGLDVIDSKTGTVHSSTGDQGTAVLGAVGNREHDTDLEEKLKAIEGAVADRRRVRITHVREYGALPLAREVDPYGLLYWRENWYVVGYCHLRENIRMFRCDRIVTIDVSGEEFQRPADFSAREHFLNVMIPRNSARASVTIRVRGTQYALDSISRHWFLGNFVHERTDGEIGLAVEVEQAAEYLPYLVLAAASEMTIVKPKELREAVVRLAKDIARDHAASGMHDS